MKMERARGQTERCLLGHGKDLGFYTGEMASLWLTEEVTQLVDLELKHWSCDLYSSALYIRPHDFKWKVLFFTTKALRGGWEVGLD